jgi:hypothetical protein
MERGLGFVEEIEDRRVGGAAVRGQGSAQREKKMLTGGASLSAGEGGGPRTDSVRSPGGPWAGSWPGPDSVPRPLYPFFVLFFSFFCFLIYFITFAKMHQNNSNRFLNSSKIPSNVLNQ